VLRYLFGDSGHMTSNDNIKLLYNTSTARIEPYFRIENHIEKIITNKLTHSPEQHVNIGMFTTNSLLFNLTKDDEYRDLRNKAIYNVVKNRNKIIDIFDKVMEKDLGSLTNDTTNDLPSRYFAFEAEEAKNKLLHNFDFLQKYLEYSRAFVEIIRQDKSTHLIKIMPDSNSSIIATKFKIYVDKSFVGSDVFLEDLESKTKYDLSINIDSNRNKGFIDLGKVLKDRKFSLSLDEHLEPKKNIYKYNLFFNDRVDSLDMTFANNISGKSLLNRDMYEAIVDESGYIHPTIPSFIDKSRTEKNTLYVKEGEHIISKDIVLPYGINLVVNQGTVLKFKNNASLLINGGLKIDGKQNNPVRIVNNSKNNIFGSVGVVGDGETKVDISFLEVYGGSEDFINGMHLSGGLSIHNHKEVKIENSSIHHNMADDGVNIKNSNFLIKNSKFYANMADQIDIDFGTGVISDSYFSQSSLIDVFTNVLAKKDDNGDGLDLSGSEVIVENNLFKGFLDKGMSIGENTHALIVNNRFNNNRSAITSKDQSKVYINNNNFINNQIDIEMYQKKKFFNHPSVYSLSKDNVDLTIKKTDKSKFFKIKGAINLDKKLDSSIFSLLGQLLWIEYE